MRLHVEIDGAAARGERLDQPDVGGVAGRADDAVLGLHQGGDALFEVARDVALVMHPDARDGVAVAARPQRGDLALDDVRMAGKAKVVVAADLDVAGTRRAALQRMAALPKLDFAADMVIINASTEEFRLRRNSDAHGFRERTLIGNSKQH